MEIKKSPKADLESKKLTFALIGLVVTLFIVWRVFEYKSYDQQTFDDLQQTVEVIEEEMVEITKQEQPKIQMTRKAIQCKVTFFWQSFPTVTTITILLLEISKQK